MAPKSTPVSPPNGTTASETAETGGSTIPPVVGINFGNAYASIAVFTKEGLAECIANEDGERQIACAISYQGEQVYIGNEAKHQLVKNAKNTITGFRDLLGKKYSEVANTPLIAPHPTEPDTPSWTVQVLTPSQSSLPSSKAPTRASSPTPNTLTLTPLTATTLFLTSLLRSASTFLGVPITGAVLTVPPHFTPTQRTALSTAAANAGINVLQLIDEAGAVSALTTTPLWLQSNPGLKPDRTQLTVDLGASSLSLTLLSIRSGLSHLLASSTTSQISGAQLDTVLTTFFSREFTKKSKLSIAGDKRAETKLLLALEHTKRTLSASPNAATVSIESLKDGVDFTSSINRMRFDTLARPVYASIALAITSLLSSPSTPIDISTIDEILFVGGSTALPGLSAHLLSALPFAQTIHTPFTSGLVTGGGVGDPTTILARGAAIQAALIAAVDGEGEPEVRRAFREAVETHVVPRTIGVVVPTADEGKGGMGEKGMGGKWLEVLLKETAIPARRSVQFEVSTGREGQGSVAVEVWEVVESVRIDKVKPAPLPPSSDDEEEEEEEEEEEVEERTKIVEKTGFLGVVVFETKLAKGAAPDKKGGKGAWSTKVGVTITMHTDGKFEVVVKEVGGGGAGEEGTGGGFTL